ncbi:MAG: hypothetical protein Fur0021_17470 [Candidatus Promineifilaceae bacterium]
MDAPGSCANAKWAPGDSLGRYGWDAQYFDACAHVDLDEVCNTAILAIPDIIQKIEALISSAQDAEP